MWAPYLSPGAAFSSFFFSSIPKLTEPIEKKIKKKKPRTWRPNQWKKKRHEDQTSKRKGTKQPTQEKKGKKKGQKVVKSCGWVLFVGPLCVFNYNIAIELWVMETENSQNVFLVSITHNSKIRKLSNGNRVIMRQTDIELWVPPFLSYKLWKLKIELWK